ncbi:MAG: helix-turn-helix transcriptional regulator [Alphaproteobacteria bacterium]|nr:helix-turn-helix transcriptional regulator [Alphaproteobacteria bacterium]
MITHSSVWQAIDALAERHGFSVSGLARRAKLDPTTINRSKRVSKTGRQRWPSTEILSKILDLTKETPEEFFNQGRNSDQPRSIRVPLLGLAQAGAGGFFDEEGHPAGRGWEEVAFPDAGGERTYALEVSGESMMPLYRHGDIIIVSATDRPRRGDKVVVRTVDDEVMAKVLYRQTANTIELHSLHRDHPPRILPESKVAWMARIKWASQ